LILGTAFFLYASLSGPGPVGLIQLEQSDDGHDRCERQGSWPDEFRYFEDPAEAYPLPVTLPPSGFEPGIANTYRIAKKIPEVWHSSPVSAAATTPPTTIAASSTATSTTMPPLASSA
jgi:hypothetical protein